MSKGLVVFIIVACLTIAAFLYTSMKRAANEQRSQSDKILKKFKAIDKDHESYSLPIDTMSVINDSTHAPGR